MSKRLLVAPTIFIVLVFLITVRARGQQPVTSEAGKSFFSGMNDVNYLWMEPDTVASRMWSIQNAGSKWIRVTFYWESIEKSRGQYDWTQADAVRDQAMHQGVQILPVLLGFPDWTYLKPNADPSVKCLFLPTDLTNCQPYFNGSYNYTHYQYLSPNKQDFIDFVTAFVGRYHNQFKYWEIWNEPNWCIRNGSQQNGGQCWAPPDADVYGDTMKSVYPAIKSIDPTAQVVLGGLSYSDLDFLHKYYIATAGFNTFDVVALHPYVSASPRKTQSCDDAWPGYTRYQGNYNWCNWSGIADIRNEMFWAGDTYKPIWLTEYGWPQKQQVVAQGEPDPVQWLLESLQDTSHYKGFVQKVFYFDWSDMPGFAGIPLTQNECPSHGVGLVGVSGTWGSDGCSNAVEQLKPAAYVYADWAREAQKVNILAPQFQQSLDGCTWVAFTGDFKDTANMSPDGVRLLLDGYDTGYNIAFDSVNLTWTFVLQPGPWIAAFNTATLPEHTVALQVPYGGTLGTFYVSQTFQVHNIPAGACP